MKMKFNQVKKKAAVLGASALGLLLQAPLVLAQTAPDPFTAAATTAKEKINAYGPELVAIAAVGVVFGIGIKYIKKIRGAS
jgi:hypothetical protein